MHALAAILVSGAILTPQALPVDFRILPSHGADGRPAVASPAPIVRESPQAPTNLMPKAGQRRPVSRRVARAPVQYPEARGFGDEVPLRFAVRQIVPAGIDVLFAPGADQDALVSWRGGGPWNHTLQAAIRPLGLRVIQQGNTVTISR